MTDSDEDDDEEEEEEEEEEVVTDTEWDDLESEDTLIGIPSSMQGPFPFHTREGAAVRLEEVGWTIGLSLEPSGAGGFATVPEVPAGGAALPPCLKKQQGWVDLLLCPKSRR